VYYTESQLFGWLTRIFTSESQSSDVEVSTFITHKVAAREQATSIIKSM